MSRILIAESDEAIAALLRVTVCRVLACDVVLAHDAAAAATALQSNPFDLVLIDIGMYSDGLHTLTKVRDRGHTCKVIALTTGVIAAPLVKTLATSDVYAVVMKPFDLQQLVEIILECVRADRVAEPNQPLVYRGAGNHPTHD
jgi:DNA-binding NtrC family response regulator